MELKVYVAVVRDESLQSLRIMDVPGFSHFSHPFTNYPNGICRYAFIKGNNRAELAKLVADKLGYAYQPNLNYVERYNSEFHHADVTRAVNEEK